MTPALKQLRESFERGIKRNQSIAGYFLNNELKTEVVRFAHEGASVPTNKTSPVGLSTSFSMFVELKYNSGITENTVLIDGTIGWKVGAVDSLKVDGKVYGKRAPLVLQVLNKNCSITSFKIGVVNGVIAGNTITVTLPAGTDVTALTPVVVHSGKMISRTGAQDFSSQKTYTVTAEDLSTREYTIIVEVLQ